MKKALYVVMLLALGCSDDHEKDTKSCDPVCSADQVCEDGVCKPIQTPVNCNPACKSDEKCEDGVCKPNQDINTCNPACKSDEKCVDGVCKPNHIFHLIYRRDCSLRVFV